MGARFNWNDWRLLVLEPFVKNSIGPRHACAEHADRHNHSGTAHSDVHVPVLDLVIRNFVDKRRWASSHTSSPRSNTAERFGKKQVNLCWVNRLTSSFSRYSAPFLPTAPLMRRTVAV